MSSHRNTLRGNTLRDGWQGSAQWYMQVHLVCAALEWAAKGVVEDPARANRGPQVDVIHLRYRAWDAATLEREWSKKKDGVGLAWCAELVWVIVDDVCRKLGIPNCFPGWSVALGRARDTLEKSRGKLPVLSWQDITTKRGVVVNRASGTVTLGRDGVPEIGMVFYRTSQPSRQSNDATGHMGMVVAVNKADGSFETIEGNQGTSNRIGRYRYVQADLQRYAFEFIHVAECAAVKDNPTGVLAPTQECFASATGTATRVQSVVGTVNPAVIGAAAGTAGVIATTNSGTQGGASGGSTTGGTPGGGDRDCSVSSVLGTSFAALAPEAKQRACADIRVKDLDVGLLFHYSELKRKDGTGRRILAADILGATYGITSATHEFFGIRNGAAVNRRNANRNGRDEHTGVGIFKMRSGRLVYITAEGSLQWHNLWQNQLLGAGYGEGRDPWRLHIERTQGSGFAELMGEVLAGEQPLNGPSGQYPRLVWAAQNGRAVVVKGTDGNGVISNLLGTEIHYRTLHDILDAIERADKAGESRDLSPVVITYNMQPIPWTKSVQQIIQVATAVVSVAMPVAGSFVSASVLGTLRTVQESLDKLMKVVSGLQGGDVITLALDLGAAFLPPEYRQYVAPAKGAYRAAVGKNPGEALRALELLARTDLGTEATKWGEQLVANVGIDLASIAKAASKPFDYVRQQVATFQVGHMIGTVADLTAGDTDFARKLLRVTGQRLSDVGYLSTFVTALAGGKHPATVPNLGGLARMVGMTGELASTIEGRTEAARSDVFAILSLLGQGFAAPCAVFRDLAYQSFRQQAEKLRAGGVRSVAAPVLVGAEDAECFAYRIRQDVPGLEVLYAEPKGGGTQVTTSGRTNVVTNVAQIDTTGRIDTSRTDTVNTGRVNTATVNTAGVNTATVNTSTTNTGTTKTDTGIYTDFNTKTNTVDTGTVNGPVTETVVHEVQCPPGYTKVGNECYPPPPVVREQECPPGYVKVGNECLPPAPAVREVQCPQGYTRVGNANGTFDCVPPPPVLRQQECPQGYTRVGNECVPPPPVVREQECPPGYTRNGDVCVPPPPVVRQPTCPPGYRLETKADGTFECVPAVTFKNDFTPQVPPGGSIPPVMSWPPLVFTVPLAPASGGCGCE